MRLTIKLSTLLLIFMVAVNTNAQKAACTKPDQTLLFPKGEKIKNSNFTGTAYLQMLVEADSQNNNSIGNVTFEPGARTK